MSKPICYACGIPRSGSTLVAQLMRATLPGWNVIATHPAADFTYRGEPLIASYRDPRDMAASRYRVRLSRSGPNCGGWTGLEAEIAVMADHVKAFMGLDGRNVVKLRYEDFWDWHDDIYDAIQHLLGIIVMPLDRMRFSSDYGVQANRERQSKLGDFNAYDETGVHGDHIATPRPGSWPDVLPESLHAPMLDAVKPLCEMLGYA